MPDFGDASMDRWLGSLPVDMRGAIGSEGSGPFAWGGALADELSGKDDGVLGDLPAIVARHPDEVARCGRARRVRMMAWIVGAADGPGPILTRLTDPDSEGEAGSSGKVGILFLEDIKAMADVLGRRAAMRMAAEASVEATVQSAMALDGETSMRRGGI